MLYNASSVQRTIAKSRKRLGPDRLANQDLMEASAGTAPPRFPKPSSGVVNIANSVLSASAEETMANNLICTPPTREAYLEAVVEELAAYCGALEQQCGHMEGLITSAVSLLKIIVKDFGVSCLKPIFGSFVERLNSIAAFLEIGLDNVPNRDTY